MHIVRYPACTFLDVLAYIAVDTLPVVGPDDVLSRLFPPEMLPCRMHEANAVKVILFCASPCILLTTYPKCV